VSPQVLDKLRELDTKLLDKVMAGDVPAADAQLVRKKKQKVPSTSSSSAGPSPKRKGGGDKVAKTDKKAKKK